MVAYWTPECVTNLSRGFRTWELYSTVYLTSFCLDMIMEELLWWMRLALSCSNLWRHRFLVYKHIPTLVRYSLASTTVVIILDCNTSCIKHGREKFSASIRVLKAPKDFCMYHNCEHSHMQMMRNLRVRKDSCKIRCITVHLILQER